MDGDCVVSRICDSRSEMKIQFYFRASPSTPSKKWYNIGVFFWGIMLLNGKWLMKGSGKNLKIRANTVEVTTMKGCLLSWLAF